MKNIEGKIISVSLASKLTAEIPVAPKPGMHDQVERPKILSGRTYKMKTPLLAAALYITINDIEIEGRFYPYEIFINTKDTTSFKWITAITRMISAVFRKGGDVSFIIEELMSVFDPNGGYHSEGVYIQSEIAEIGMIIRSHLSYLGILGYTEPAATGEQPKAAQCPKCQQFSYTAGGGCASCVSCGYSKCG